MTDVTNSELRGGYLDSCLVVLIWSGFILVSRFGGKSELLSYDVVALRFGTAALLLLPFWWWRHRLKLWQGKIIALGMIGGIGYCTFVYYAFKHAPAAHAGILLPGLLPFESTLLSWLLLRETITRRRLAGLIAIALGVVSLVIENRSTGFSTLPGDLAFIGAGTLWALYSVLARQWRIAPWDATIGLALVSASIYLPVYLLILPKQMALASWHTILTQAFYQGIMAMIIAMIFYMRAMKALGPSALGSLMALVPVISGIAAVPLLNEPLTPLILLGLALTTLGAWLGSRSQ